MYLYFISFVWNIINLTLIRFNSTRYITNNISFFLFQLDDTALQLYKDGDYGAYLDLEASISEQQEEFEGFQTK